MSHPNVDELAGFFEAVALWHVPFLHVLDCPRCTAVAKGVMASVTSPEPAAGGGQTGDYEPVFRRTHAVARAMATARKVQVDEAVELLAELLAVAPEERGVALLTDERFRNLALAEQLLALARSERERREEVAGLAVLLLEGWTAPRREVLDLRAEARCELADALRWSGHHETAERELVCAAADLNQSTDPLCRGAFCRTLARLRSEQGRCDEAEALIDRAADLFEDAADPLAQGDALLTAGQWALARAEPRRATACFDAALTLAELPAAQCRDALHDLVKSLLLDGRKEEAALLLRNRGLAVGGGLAAVYRILAERFESLDLDAADRREGQ